MDVMLKLLVAAADPVKPDAEPVAKPALAENCVVDGDGVPNTENVRLSMLTFPVPLRTYSAPTTGVVAVVKVKVTIPPETEYAETAKGVAWLACTAVNVGGAPGPICDRGRHVVPL